MQIGPCNTSKHSITHSKIDSKHSKIKKQGILSSFECKHRATKQEKKLLKMYSYASTTVIGGNIGHFSAFSYNIEIPPTADS